MRQIACPAPARLGMLIAGSLSEIEQAELTEHLDQCENCQQVLEELSGGREWWIEPARQMTTGRPAVDSAYWPALKQLEGPANKLETQAEPIAKEELHLSFLSPSDEPGHLGRLGSYDVIEVLGHGGMGVVLKAFDSCLQRFVAIKVLAVHFANNQTARQRFCREARAAAAINHKNVVAIYQVDEIDNLPYLVMEYVPGASLEEHLERTGRFALEDILRIGAQVASGLAAAHAQGLIHRDIKPANILLETGAESVKLTDFGLARAADDAKLTQSGTVAGTPLYMAPEQARGETLDYRADLFSLGSVLYAMCTGVTPFEAGTPLAVLRRITEERPRPIHEINPAIPDWMEEIVEKLQAKKPANRFESAAEVAEMLNQYLAHVRQPSMVHLPRCPRLRARQRRLLLAGFTFLGFACGFGASELWRAVSPAQPSTLSATALAGNPEVDSSSSALKTLHANMGPIWSVAFAPDGSSLALALDDGTVKIWDLKSERVSATLNAHKGPVWAVAYNKDGSLLATASDDGTAKVWNLATAEARTPFRHRTAVRAVAFAGDGKSLATGSRDGSVRIWSLSTGEETVIIHGHEGVIMSVAFSPDGKTVASASGDKTVKLWDAATGHEQLTLSGHTGGVYSVAFSPDNKFIASGGWDKTVQVWDTSTGTSYAVFRGHAQDVWSVAFAADGRTLASGSEDRTVKVWDLASQQELATLKGHTSTVYSVAFSPDSQTLASGGRDGTVKLWDVNLRKEGGSK
ncbi:MAG TPA: protein kinase [Gemmataceae bacterium]|nr:protein kinase [Gemmataceae bacterium]